MSKARDLADGKFDTDTLVVDAANNRVGIGTDSPEHLLHLKGSFPYIAFQDTDNGATSKHTITGNSDGNMYFDSVLNNSSGNSGFIFRQNQASISSLLVDSSGCVTMPYQPAVYRYQNTSSQTVASAVDTQVDFDTNGFAVGIIYSSGNFSVPVAGKYFVSAVVRFQNHSSMPIQIAIKHNGNYKIYRYIQASSTSYHGINASVLLDMAASDYFSVYAYQGSGSNQTITGNSDGATAVSAFKVS